MSRKDSSDLLLNLIKIGLITLIGYILIKIILSLVNSP